MTERAEYALSWHEDEFLESWQDEYGEDEYPPDYEWQHWWEDLCEDLTEVMKKLNPDDRPWTAKVRGFGWLSQDGEMPAKRLKDGRALLAAVLPDTQNRFEIYVDDGEIRIHNAHHDRPMGGEWYTIKPAEEVD